MVLLIIEIMNEITQYIRILKYIKTICAQVMLYSIFKIFVKHYQILQLIVISTNKILIMWCTYKGVLDYQKYIIT